MKIGDVDLWIEQDGAGPPVLFSHGLLWSGRMFAPQVAALSDRYRCVRYDHRGQGRSEVPDDRSITIERVYQDAVALIEQLELGPCHFVGLSMGGFVGMRIASRRPELLRCLTLMATGADAEPAAHIPRYRAMNLVARLGGMRLLSSRVLSIMCGRSFLRDPDRASERSELRDALLANRPTIYRAVNGVLERASVEHDLQYITVPTLVMRGEQDAAISRDRAERLAAGIAGAELIHIPDAGHTLTLEQPAAATAALASFLDGLPR